MSSKVIGLSLSRCERCQRQAAEVIESRRHGAVVRRRKRCRACCYRFTNYELSAAEYERLTSAALQLNHVYQALGAAPLVPKDAQPLTQSGPELPLNPKNPCKSCRFADGDSCSFGFPEYNKADAIDCAMYEATSKALTMARS